MKKILSIGLVSLIVFGCTPSCYIGKYKPILESYEIEIENLDTNIEIGPFNMANDISQRVLSDNKLKRYEKMYLIQCIVYKLKDINEYEKNINY